MPTLNLTPEIKDYAMRCLENKSLRNPTELNWLYNHAITAIAKTESHTSRTRLMDQVTKIPDIVDRLLENTPETDVTDTTVVMLAAFLLTNRISQPFAATLLPDFDASYFYACMALKDNAKLTPTLTARQLENNLKRARPWNHGNERPQHMRPAFQPDCLANLFLCTPAMNPGQIPDSIFAPDITEAAILDTLTRLRTDNYNKLLKNGGKIDA